MKAASQMHHTGITVSDLERSAAFYGELFGFQEVLRSDYSGEEVAQLLGVTDASITVLMLGAENSILELVKYHTPPSAPPSQTLNDTLGVLHVCIVVEDISSSLARALELGATATAPPSSPIAAGPAAGGRFAYLRGPDGETVELIQLGPGITLKALGISTASSDISNNATLHPSSRIVN